MKAKFEEIYQGREYFFENMAVSLFFNRTFPVVMSREEVWRSYVVFCKVYSFLHFLAILSVEVELPAVIGGPNVPREPFAKGSREAMFHAIVMGARSLLHNQVRRAQIADEFFQNESATLAHMVILLGL